MHQLKDNLRTQLDELETLQSMFCNPGELRIEDPCVIGDINAYLNGYTSEPPPYLDLVINILVDGLKFELCANLSGDYPAVEPDVFVRNHKLNKQQHAKLNRDLTEYVCGLDRGDPCIFSAVSWLQDNAMNYVTLTNIEETEDGSKQDKEKNQSFVRYWIYSHHIYSKTKRREIVDLANVLKITGFCMPGKPGIVCVEGRTSDCAEWWQGIKAMNWKRIFLKLVQECPKGATEEHFRKFRTFEEVIFQNCNIKCNHMDMGELSKFLGKHDCAGVFKEIFGVEAKTSATD